jgi:hypothetical protein
LLGIPQQVAIITTSKADADAIIAALRAPPPPDADTEEGTGPGRPDPGAAAAAAAAPGGLRWRQRRRGQVEYVPAAAAKEGEEGGEVAPGVVASYEAGTASWGGGQKPGVQAASEKQGEVTKGVKTQMKKSKVRVPCLCSVRFGPVGMPIGGCKPRGGRA